MAEEPAKSVYCKTTFSVPKMDCPSEENLIRMALSDLDDIRSLAFDLSNRELHAVHRSNPDKLLGRLKPLKLGAAVKQSSALAAETISTVHQCSTFSIPKMDCPSEENLIRMALGNLKNIVSIKFELSDRKLSVVHEGNADEILQRLQPLKLGAVLTNVTSAPLPEPTVANDTEDKAEAKTLRLLLVINGVMFFLELILGLLAQSTGLIADSLDMFADAAVYGLALYAVGRAAKLKSRAAHLAGWLQLALAVGALMEVARRFLYGSEPESTLMMGVGFLALIANVSCLMLISRKRDRGAHMTASYIFSANDVIANLGVIAAGILVAWTGSPLPDLVIGTLIGLIVMSGARRILQLK